MAEIAGIVVVASGIIAAVSGGIDLAEKIKGVSNSFKKWYKSRFNNAKSNNKISHESLKNEIEAEIENGNITIEDIKLIEQYVVSNNNTSNNMTNITNFASGSAPRGNFGSGGRYYENNKQ